MDLLSRFSEYAGPGQLTLTSSLLAAGFVAVCLAVFASQVSTVWQFVWNCFLQPLGKQTDQAGRLNRFYQGQAESSSFPDLVRRETTDSTRSLRQDSLETLEGTRDDAQAFGGSSSRATTQGPEQATRLARHRRWNGYVFLRRVGTALMTSSRLERRGDEQGPLAPNPHNGSH